jgi:hypothetical protein
VLIRTRQSRTDYIYVSGNESYDALCYRGNPSHVLVTDINADYFGVLLFFVSPVSLG